MSLIDNNESMNPHYSGICGRYLFYPDITGKRITEGGLRFDRLIKTDSSDNKPLVSIITTVLNNEQYIEKSICSVLQQSYDSIEYIIIDGASTDGTLEVILKYSDVIDYYVSEPDESLYEGINKGITLSRGDYILILNSDDWYEQNCVTELVQSIKSNNVSLVSALATETDSYGNILRKIPMVPFGPNVHLRMPLRHETMLISRTIYNAIGLYDTTYKIISDLKFTQKIYELGTSFKQINKYLMYFRKIGKAHVLTPEFIKERKRLLYENFSFLNEIELDFLANDYSKNTDEYISIMKKYKDNRKFIQSIKSFLFLHGVSSVNI